MFSEKDRNLNEVIKKNLAHETKGRDDHMSRKYDKQKITICLIKTYSESLTNIAHISKSRYIVVTHDSIDNAMLYLRKNTVACIIAYVGEKYYNQPARFGTLTTLFPMIPVIAVIEKKDIKLILECGKIGVEHIVMENDSDKIVDIIDKLSYNSGFSINWDDFNIDTNECSQIVKKALSLIERNYHKINRVHEIADKLQIPPETLSRHFSNHCNLGIKKLSTLAKLKYALYLMQNNGLKLKEISDLAGFTNELCFNRCFHRYFTISPTEWRLKGNYDVSDWERIINDLQNKK